MTRDRKRCLSMLLALFLTAPFLAACGGSSDSTGPDGEGAQTATATATPSAGTIARGGATTSTTLAQTTTGGLAMGPTAITKPFAGISVSASTATTITGSTRTAGYLIAASASVPVGNHEIKFTAPISGYTGNGSAPTSVATFTLTVTQ